MLNKIKYDFGNNWEVYNIMKTNLKRLTAMALCTGMLCMTACGSHKDKDEKKDETNIDGSEGVEGTIHVEPIENIADDFIRGVDVSSYIVEKDSGVQYKDFEGNILNDEEFFSFLADCGINWVRVRVWNNPYDRDGNGYGGGNNDIEKAITIGKYATDAGMKVLIDFHYSDFWTDPGKQQSPVEWTDKTVDEKAVLLCEFTKDSLTRLKQAGINVSMVQIGNETNNGIAGEKNPDNVYKLMKAGSEAIRGVSKDIKIAVHYTNPESVEYTYFAGKLIDAGVDFDVFATSYYPYWHGTLENLKNNLQAVVNKYHKEVMVAETSYAYTTKDGDGFANNVGENKDGFSFTYDISVQGQASEIRDVMATINSIGDNGLGVFYWEPAWIPVEVWKPGSDVYESNKVKWEKYGSGWASSFAASYDPEDAGKYFGGSSWDNQALFDFEGNPLESLKVFLEVTK